MKVETKFHPITITLETAQEFDFMWDALEQAYETYHIDSPIRNFLIDAINSMAEVHSVQPSAEDVLQECGIHRFCEVCDCDI